MHQTVKALGYITILIWLLALILPITVALSLMDIVDAQSIILKEPS
ncbi:hypothetical protein H5T51_02305 [Candidatus Bathyarchaeota archaeon]|nr:hypothetical protein [Candidatus Bathyarchaeota archaeon]